MPHKVDYNLHVVVLSFSDDFGSVSLCPSLDWARRVSFEDNEIVLIILICFSQTSIEISSNS